MNSVNIKVNVQDFYHFAKFSLLHEKIGFLCILKGGNNCTISQKEARQGIHFFLISLSI